jgi:hypothetical protein
MILSRSNLLASQGTSKDSPILNNLHVTWDGSTVAFDGRALLCVSPVAVEMEDKVTLRDTGRPNSETGVTVSTESVKEVLKNLPVDKKFDGVREHVDLSPAGVFTIDDGKREKTITAKVYPRQFVDYKAVLTNAKKSPAVARVVLNGKRLRNLLDMLDKICPDSSGDSPVFLEFTEDNDILIRAVNPLNSQRVVAYMASYKNEEGQWLEEDEWEKNISTAPASTAKAQATGGNGTSMSPSARPTSSAGHSQSSAALSTISRPLRSLGQPSATHLQTSLSLGKKSAARKLNNEWRQ